MRRLNGTLAQTYHRSERQQIAVGAMEAGAVFFLFATCTVHVVTCAGNTTAPRPNVRPRPCRGAGWMFIQRGRFTQACGRKSQGLLVAQTPPTLSSLKTTRTRARRGIWLPPARACAMRSRRRLAPLFWPAPSHLLDAPGQGSPFRRRGTCSPRAVHEPDQGRPQPTTRRKPVGSRRVPSFSCARGCGRTGSCGTCSPDQMRSASRLAHPCAAAADASPRSFPKPERARSNSPPYFSCPTSQKEKEAVVSGGHV